MNEQQKGLLAVALAGALILTAARAHAQVLPLAQGAPQVAARPADEPGRKDPDRPVRRAVRQLEQAALQLDYASNSQELAWLQLAHDELAAALDDACCRARQRIAELEVDLNHVIVRDAARLGSPFSSSGDSFGPPAPTHGQLDRLVLEGQAILRDTPPAGRLEGS
jgi:hypothetical protein